MIIIWSLLLTAAASAHKVVESTEDIGPEAFVNITTLYPVANQNTNNINHNENPIKNTTDNKVQNIKEKPKPESKSWKIEAAFAESNLDEEENTTTSAPEVKQKNETKEFRPSQHLGSFLSDDDVVPTRETFDSFTPVIKKPASGFASSKEVYHSNKQKELLRTHKEYPYKFESSIFTRAKDSWRPDRHKPWPTGSSDLDGSRERPGKGWGVGSSGIDYLERPGKGNHESSGFEGFGYRPGKPISGNTGFDGDKVKGWDTWEPKPTIESPVKLPAGGLYKYTDPFKEKPGKHDEDFGLEFNNDVKESSLKKRANPWEGILRMLTAFIPVGIIISALTPSIITIENTGPDNTYPSNIYRRSETDTSELPAISERCRRRLLCELHNEKNYSTAQSSQNPRKWKQCHRIRCEDSAALTKTLQWLLERQTNQQHNSNVG